MPLAAKQEQQRQQQLKISVIVPRDRKPNPAKSWVWQRRKTVVVADPNKMAETTLPEYLKDLGLGGSFRVVGGRRCLAHEDPRGFAEALLELFEENDNAN